MNYRYLFVAFFVLWNVHVHAQEFAFTVKVNTPTLQIADPGVFKTFEKDLTEFLNNQRFTDMEVQDEEKIKVTLNLNLVKEQSQKDFIFSMAILAVRPVYNSSYETVLFQYIDDKVVISYEPGNALIFNPNSYNDNLTSILGYYAYIILGLDKDSFADKGGDAMYANAQAVIGSLPTGISNSDDYGWSANKAGLNKSRSSFVENLLSPKLNDFRIGFYEYHRQGLDLTSTNVDDARKNIVNAMKSIEKSYNSYVNSLMINVFGLNKGNELVQIFKPAPKNEKAEIYKIMSKLDPAGLQKYIDLR
ncbi:MAG: DUF4835 family protein [Saprospiraceae bacterium]|nr:DUF4835 family protein [Saprospiraceae bacterium]